MTGVGRAFRRGLHCESILEKRLLYTSGVLYGTAYTGGIPACGCHGRLWRSAPLIIKGGVLYGTTSQEDSFYDNAGD